MNAGDFVLNGTPAAIRALKVAKFIWVLAAIALLFVAENIWIDPIVRHRLRKFPSFVPQATTGTWFLMFGLLLISGFLLIFCQALLFRSAAPSRIKWTTGTLVLALLFAIGKWSWITTGHKGFPFLAFHQNHSVILTWEPSSSHVAGYNIYRSPTCGAGYQRINTSPIHTLTYTDTVEGDATYCYVVRAVDSSSRESLDSNEISVVVP